MNHKLRLAALACGFMLAAGAGAATINFDDLAVGSVLSTQYAGVSFTPNAFSGPGSSTSGASWTTTTDMTIASVNGDVAGLGAPSLVSGNLLHSLTGWLGESDGDPSFRVAFDAPINAFSADFAGVSTAADVTIWAFNGATQVGIVFGSNTGQIHLSLSAPTITSVVIRPGSFNDWVGVDNISYTPAAGVPEASTCAMMGIGLALLAFRRRKSA